MCLDSVVVLLLVESFFFVDLRCATLAKEWSTNFESDGNRLGRLAELKFSVENCDLKDGNDGFFRRYSSFLKIGVRRRADPSKVF
jgi:hypothetical protein